MKKITSFCTKLITVCTITLLFTNAMSDGRLMTVDNGDDQNRCRFKGVVPHPNGRWGAQIYANHQRVWLGTFKTEIEAATAYDRAAMKLRSDDIYHNIYLSREKASLEADFQRRLSTEDVLGMIKEGLYDSHVAEFKRILYSPNGSAKPEKTMATKLFEKVLTPSDVGKLNRLVIPKKSAIKFKQRLSEGGGEGDDEKEFEIEFFDRKMKCWRFRFYYWKSSQSFVFTKGWSKFVKGNRLRENDAVVFYVCVRRGEDGDAAGPTPFFTVDILNRASASTSAVVNRITGLPEFDRNVQEIETNRTIRLFGVDIAVNIIN